MNPSTQMLIGFHEGTGDLSGAPNSCEKSLEARRLAYPRAAMTAWYA